MAKGWKIVAAARAVAERLRTRMCGRFSIWVVGGGMEIGCPWQPECFWFQQLGDVDDARLECSDFGLLTFDAEPQKMNGRR